METLTVPPVSVAVFAVVAAGLVLVVSAVRGILR
jgi:hypothetical protein